MADAVWKDYQKGVLPTTSAVLVTVPTGKKWAMVDIVLFNRHNTSAREAELWVGGSSSGDQFYRYEMASYETTSIVLNQKLPAGTVIRGRASGVGSVNWFLSALEVDA